MKLIPQLDKLKFNEPTTKAQLQKLIKQIETFEEELSETPLIVKKAINCLVSCCHATDNGLYIGPNNQGLVRRILQEFDDYQDQLLAQVDDEAEEQLTYTEVVSEFLASMTAKQKTIKVFDVIEVEDEYADTTEELPDVSKAVARQRHLNLDTKQPYILFNHSIIPLVERRLNTKKLGQLGLDVFEFEQYFIFKNQTILGISLDYIREQNDGVAKKRQKSAYQLATDLLNEEYNTMSLLYAEPMRIKEASGFVFFWLMPTNLLAQVSKQVGVVNGWGLNI